MPTSNHNDVLSLSRFVIVGQNCTRLEPKWENLGLFNIRFQYKFAWRDIWLQASGVTLARWWVRLEPNVTNIGFKRHILVHFVSLRWHDWSILVNKTILTQNVSSSRFRVTRSRPQVGVRLAPIGTYPAVFQIRFQYILAHRDKMY